MTTPAAPPGASTPVAPPRRGPLLPLDIIDAATQRLYAISLFALLQTYKLLHVCETFFALRLPWSAAAPGRNDGGLVTYLCLDAAFVLCLYRLRIPRLDWNLPTAWFAIACLAAGNYVVLGDWTVATVAHALAPTSVFAAWQRQLAIDEVSVNVDSLLRTADHLMGQFTIDILPFASARLDPPRAGSATCLPVNRAGQPTSFVAVPLVINNTGLPSFVQYSIQDFATGHLTYVELGKADLWQLQPATSSHRRRSPAHEPAALDDDALDKDWERWMGSAPLTKNLASPPPPSTGSSGDLSLKIKQTGVLRLLRVLDGDRNDVDVVHGIQVPITQCPTISFAGEGETVVHGCQGATATLPVVVHGVPPLTLSYSRHRSGSSAKAEVFSLTGVVAPKSVASSDSVDTSYEWALARQIDVPLRASFDLLGAYEYRLEEVRDSLGHTSRPGRSSATTGLVYGHEQAQTRLVGCLGKTLGLAKNRSLTLDITRHGGDEQRWQVAVRYEPDVEVVPPDAAWTRHFPLPRSRNAISVDEPGTYELIDLQGKYCPGSIVGPPSCAVAWLPVPTLHATFETIKDECAGAVGIKANVALSGTPPYTVHYLTSREGSRAQEASARFSTDNGAFGIQPTDYGIHTVNLVRVSDANYRDIPLEGDLRAKADIQPLASASFVQTHASLYSCSGDTLTAQMNLIGKPPFKVDLDIISRTHREKVQIVASQNAHLAHIRVPAEIERLGGRFTVSVASIEDGRGCRRTLSVPNLHVDVERSVPTARFLPPGDSQPLSLKAGAEISLPLVLSGKAPWTVKYRLTQTNGKSQTLEEKVARSTASLSADIAGKYELVSVRDAHCLGEVPLEGRSLAVVDLPTPKLAMSLVKQANRLDKTPSSRRVCQGQMESLDLDLAGEPPFTISYEVLHRGHIRRSQVTATEHSAEIYFDTREAGTRRYKIVRINDANYPAAAGSEDSRDVRSGAVLTSVEVEVLSLPEASFGSTRPVSLCMGSALADTSKDKATKLDLRGQEPFDIDFDLYQPGIAAARHMTVKAVTQTSWTSAVDYVFSQAGRYRLTIAALRDSHGCSRTYEAGAGPTLAIEVAATASIAPSLSTADHCVGDAIDFTLQGSSPWSVTYHWTPFSEDGKAKTDEKTVNIFEPSFSRLASAAGTYIIRSIGHRDNSCRSQSEITKRIHPLPNVRIRKGGKETEAIHAGETAEIVFHLQGTPPFSVTYQRTASGKSSEVLEKHTVSDIREKHYSFTTSEPGTWSVTSISDAFCTFPRTTTAQQGP